MQTLKELYKIGPGPSSSHTIAPKRACEKFIEQHGHAHRYKVELYGSLSLTGKGHFTDRILEKTLAPSSVEICFCNQWQEIHPNGFYLMGFDQENNMIAKWTVFSLGGGSIEIKEFPQCCELECYPEKSLEEIQEVCKVNNWSLVDYVSHYDQEIESYLNEVLTAMLNSVDRGIVASGDLPGTLKVARVAKSLFLQASNADYDEKNRLLQMAYAYAASEENASLGEVVTAPTLGACGVMASLIYYFYTDVGVPRNKLIQALMVAGVFGNLIKKNATISGAIGGCQAEVGTACAMASAACAYLNGLNMKQIEYAAEIGIEHHLGLTCDPVGGYVIIPCIERNDVGILLAMDACLLAKHMTKLKGNRISFDMVVKTMNYTGEKIIPELKETSLGGLAFEYRCCHDDCGYVDNDIELDDHLVFDEVVLDDNEEPASPIKFKL